MLASALLAENGKIIEEVPAPPITSCIFEGGGIRGISYAGVVDIFDQLHVLPSLERVGGSSIGAIASMLLAIGYSPRDAIEVLKKMSFKDFLEKRVTSPLIPEIIRKGKEYFTILTTNDHALSSGNKLFEWLEEMIEKKLGRKNATFADLAALKAKTGTDQYKFLYITGSNLTKNRVEVFSHETTPNMPIALAARISASLPGALKTVKWDSGQGECVYTDGGVMDNVPYFMLNKREHCPDDFKNFNDVGVNPGLLIVKVDRKDELMRVLWNSGELKIINGLKDLVTAFFEAMHSRDSAVYEKFSTNTIQVYDCGIDALQVDLLTLDKLRLFDSGRKAALEWIQNHVSEAYKINTYKDEEAWLTAKDEKELAQIYFAYERMLDSADEKQKKELKAKLTWLEKYMLYRTRKSIHPEIKPDFEFTPHIDISPIKPREMFDTYLIKDMQQRISMLNERIQQIVKNMTHSRAKLNKVCGNLHENENYQKMDDYIALLEEFKNLQINKRDLENKMHIQFTSPDYCLHDGLKEYEFFKTTIQNLIANKITAISPQFSLMTVINENLKQEQIKFKNEAGSEIVHGLKSLENIKTYLIALILYLNFCQNDDRFIKEVNKLYFNLFGIAKLPHNLHDLGILLKKEKSELLLSAYRIERLMKKFCSIDKPSQKEMAAKMTIDSVFQSLPQQNTIVFPSHDQLISGQLFSIFYRGIKNKMMDDHPSLLNRNKM